MKTENRNWNINPDKEIVSLVEQGIKERGGYCPCEITKTADTKCPCRVMREQNICRCGLFI